MPNSSLQDGGQRTGTEPNGTRARSKQEAATRSTQPGLYLVATPIGNARDITLRALDVLEAADYIACEDTRVSGKLMTIYGLKKSLIAYHEHNADKVRPRLLNDVENGKTVALISDAGTPLISDPGFKLVRDCRAKGLPVYPLPGASSVMAALVVAGLPTDRFLFAGFPPAKQGARRKFLESLKQTDATLVLFESPKRLAASLKDAAEVLGSREATVCRELTKLYEETRNGTLDSLADQLAAEAPPKGEIVLVIGPPTEKPPLEQGSIDDLLVKALDDHKVKEAAALVAEMTGLPKRDLYQRALTLKGKG